MEAKEAERRGLSPLDAFRGIAVTSCDPDEMGTGPVFSMPKLLARHGLRVNDVGLFELSKALAAQALYCRDRLGIDPKRYNGNGGAIAIGHPYGMSGARLVGHSLTDRGVAPRRQIRRLYKCVGGGMGAAGLLEVL